MHAVSPSWSAFEPQGEVGATLWINSLRVSSSSSFTCLCLQKHVPHTCNFVFTFLLMISRLSLPFNKILTPYMTSSLVGHALLSSVASWGQVLLLRKLFAQPRQGSQSSSTARRGGLARSRRRGILASLRPKGILKGASTRGSIGGQDASTLGTTFRDSLADLMAKVYATHVCSLLRPLAHASGSDF